MKRILHFLASDGAFLYESRNCRIVDSEYVDTFGGTGSVMLRNDILELRFWLERDRLFLDLRAVGSRESSSWFSIDIVRQLLTGEIADKSVMDQENTAFLKEHFDNLEELFSMPNLPTTESACKQLEKERSKRLFG